MLSVRENPNSKVVESIRKRLIITGGQCPCVSEECWDEDTRCICKDFSEKDTPGFCHCHLYEKVEDTE
jgi:hypothetical protein